MNLPFPFLAFAPDGSYVPRILFLNSEGELLTDVINEQVHLQK